MREYYSLMNTSETHREDHATSGLWQRLFVAHPAAVSESYGQHGAEAAWIGLQLIGAGLACCLHALVPGLCTRTASRRLQQVQQRISARYERQSH